MGNFINGAEFVKIFPSNENFGIANVGYDDFVAVEPLLNFRVLSGYTWHFIVSGKGSFEIGGKIYHLQSGQAFFIPPGTEMRYYPDGKEPWEYVWFTLSGNEAKHYSDMLGFSLESPVITVKYFQKLNRSLKRMLDTLMDGGGYFSALSCFYEIMEICTSYMPRTGIQDIKSIIDESFTLSAFSIDGLCRDVGISHAHLLRLFKEAYGTTIVKYVVKKRIEFACELLTSSDMSVKTVAYSCGFSDELHFMKTFKKEVGVSALAYRKEAGKANTRV